MLPQIYSTISPVVVEYESVLPTVIVAAQTVVADDSVVLCTLE